MGKLLKRAAGRHAYLRVHGFYKTPSQAIHIFQAARKKVAAASPPSFTRACIYLLRAWKTSVPALVSPFQKISSFRAINFNLSRQSDAPKIVICRSLCKKFGCIYSLHCTYDYIYPKMYYTQWGEAVFNTVPLTTRSDWHCSFHAKNFFN